MGLAHSSLIRLLSSPGGRYNGSSIECHFFFPFAFGFSCLRSDPSSHDVGAASPSYFLLLSLFHFHFKLFATMEGDKRPLIIGLNSVLMALSTIAIVTRLLTRTFLIKRVGSDDGLSPG